MSHQKVRLKQLEYDSLIQYNFITILLKLVKTRNIINSAMLNSIDQFETIENHKHK